ncbi:MAG: hypothetical protein KDA87_09280 [Planctomycetales bacterium]|nr:hypothetical protein [Planctomycetales bacterium]
MFHHKKQNRRRGNVLVVACLLIFVIVSFTALVVDLGYIHNAKVELQRSADAAALAACWELGDSSAQAGITSQAMLASRQEAQNYATVNEICKAATTLGQADVEFGTVNNFSLTPVSFDTSDPSKFNAVRVRIRRDGDLNEDVPFFFGKVWGTDGKAMTAEATAAMVRDIRGFKIPEDGSNLNILPFALDEYSWVQLLAGSGSDNWHWNPDNKSISSGSDGTLEVNLYPQGTGSPGNCGTVDIGGSNNSTNDIARQILTGISASDMNAMGGTLEFDANGELILNGDTGISAGVKDELASIVGETRIIPIFSQVQGPGNNADYTIVQWAGVRIMAVKLTGSKKSKYLMVQPAPCVTQGIIPGDGTGGTTEYVYSRAVLIR